MTRFRSTPSTVTSATAARSGRTTASPVPSPARVRTVDRSSADERDCATPSGPGRRRARSLGVGRQPRASALRDDGEAVAALSGPPPPSPLRARSFDPRELLHQRHEGATSSKRGQRSMAAALIDVAAQRGEGELSSSLARFRRPGRNARCARHPRLRRRRASTPRRQVLRRPPASESSRHYADCCDGSRLYGRSDRPTPPSPRARRVSTVMLPFRRPAVERRRESPELEHHRAVASPSGRSASSLSVICLESRRPHALRRRQLRAGR